MEILTRKRVGRLMIALGVIAGGWYLQKDKAAAWQPFFVMTVERVTLPEGGKLKRSYHLKTASGTLLNVAAVDLFDHVTLMKQKLPVEAEVFGEAAAPGETLEVQGMKLKDGTVILDEAKLQSRQAPLYYALLAAAAACVLVGLGFQIKRA